jgi:tRNA threonylcarbamoyladenosine biosynthesis protein TsaB
VLVAAIDSSTLTLSVALCEVADGRLRVVAEASEPAAQGGHGGRLPGALEDLLAASGVALAAVDAWACGLGPGSFTGLRIGLSTWKGFAYALRRPLLGAPGLEAMALEAAASAPAGATLVPLLDARKAEVYAGFYRRREDGGVERLAPDAALAPAALEALLRERAEDVPRPVLFGEGVAAGGAPLAGFEALAGPLTPGAAFVARLCLPALPTATFEPERVFGLEPHYVRKSEAEVKFPHGLPPRQP